MTASRASRKRAGSGRAAIIKRMDINPAPALDRPADLPLDWKDIGFLCQGLIFAGRPLSLATRAVTERYSLGPRGAWMLNLISAGIVYPHELSDMFRIGRSLVSAELTRLTEAGLIESQPGKADRRRSELALTPKGKAARESLRGELESIITAALSGYKPDEVRLAARILNDLRNITRDPAQALGASDTDID